MHGTPYHRRLNSHVKRALLLRVIERDGLNCIYCDTPTDYEARRQLVLRPMPLATTIDHVIPRVERGSHTEANSVIACHQCNHDRGDEDASVFLFWRLQQDDTIPR